jgi:hypothetical protein
LFGGWSTLRVFLTICSLRINDHVLSPPPAPFCIRTLVVLFLERVFYDEDDDDHDDDQFDDVIC